MAASSVLLLDDPLDRGVHPTADALYWAARESREEMVTLLLERGAERGWLTHCLVPFPDFDPLAMSLRLALGGLDVDMVRFLLERGADPNHRYAEGMTPLMLLAREVSLGETQAAAFEAEGPMPTEICGQETHAGMSVVLGFLASLVNLPALSIPAGLTAAGLPVGLQVIGPRHREDLVLATAARYEATNPWSRYCSVANA